MLDDLLFAYSCYESMFNVMYLTKYGSAQFAMTTEDVDQDFYDDGVRAFFLSGVF